MALTPSSLDWATTAAVISAMVDVITLGRESFQYYLKRRQEDEQQFVERGRALEKALSTYTPRELDAIQERINACQDRFVQEGVGERRRVCLCSVLKDVRDGDGGSIPVLEWQHYYERLECAKG